MKWIAIVLLVLLALAPGRTKAQTYQGVVVYIVDGDTIDVFALTKVRVRLADIDTPEHAPRAKCALEAALALRAKIYVQELLLSRTVIVRVRKVDRYNRDFAYVSLDGMDVGGHLIQKGVAKPWLDRQPKPFWCGQ